MHCWSLLEFRKLRSVKQRFRITFTLLFISVPHSKQLFQVAAGFWIVFSGWNMTKVDHYCFFFPLLDWLLNLNHKIIIINLEIWKQNMSSNKQHFYVITFLVYYSIKLALKFCILKAHYTYMPLLFFFPHSIVILYLRFGAQVLQDNFVAELSTHYQNYILVLWSCSTGNINLVFLRKYLKIIYLRTEYFDF